MPADFFRINRGLEIFSDTDFQTPLVQILTSTAAPDVQADAMAAPVGSLWVVNNGTQSTTRTYQKFRDTFNSKQDWRDITQTLSWREAVEVRQNIATTLPTGTAGNPVVVDGESITNGERVLFSNLTATAATDTLQSGSANAGTDNAITTANTYYFTVATNGGAPIEYSVVIAGATTFDALATLMTTAWGLGTVTWDDANDQFLFTTTATGSSASVEAFLATATTPSLFTTVQAEAAGGPIVLTEELGILGVGADIYVYDQPTGLFYLDPAQSATDGDAVFVKSGTDADISFLYNGTQWVQFGSGTAAEEDAIRDFIGKDAAGIESPDYEAPSETPATSEPADRDPFTDATGQGTSTTSQGYIAWYQDNLELAIAKINQEVFQNNRHMYVASATSLVDTVPTWVDGAEWMVRVQEGASVRQYIVTATTDGTNVDYTTHTLQKIGINIAGLTIVVTVSAGSLVLTVTTTNAGEKAIRRITTIGAAGTGALSGFMGALHVYS
jgi:hypothetical protein